MKAILVIFVVIFFGGFENSSKISAQAKMDYSQTFEIPFGEMIDGPSKTTRNICDVIIIARDTTGNNDFKILVCDQADPSKMGILMTNNKNLLKQAQPGKLISFRGYYLKTVEATMDNKSQTLYLFHSYGFYKAVDLKEKFKLPNASDIKGWNKIVHFE